MLGEYNDSDTSEHLTLYELERRMRDRIAELENSRLTGGKLIDLNEEIDK